MKKGPNWILDKTVIAIHKRQIAEHGGDSGIRDEGLLESALCKPKNLYAYSNPLPDIAAMAASYAYGIITNHPFVDGNKRTAFVVCRLFLEMNGISLHANKEEKYITFLWLASGELKEEELAAWIRKNSQRKKGKNV